MSKAAQPFSKSARPGLPDINQRRLNLDMEKIKQVQYLNLKHEVAESTCEDRAVSDSYGLTKLPAVLAEL